MKLLALDYDGVLVDSSQETFVTAYNVYLKLAKPDEFKNKRLTCKYFLNNKEKFMHKLEELNRIRVFLMYAGSFVPAIYAIYNGIKVKDEEQLMNIKIGNLEYTKLKEFFHKERERLQEE